MTRARRASHHETRASRELRNLDPLRSPPDEAAIEILRLAGGMEKMIGQRLNGHVVIAAMAIPDAEGMKPNRRVVLVDRGVRPDGSRYVVSTAVEGEIGWGQGVYRKTLRDAWAEFCLLVDQKVMP